MTAWETCHPAPLPMFFTTFVWFGAFYLFCHRKIYIRDLVKIGKIKQSHVVWKQHEKKKRPSSSAKTQTCVAARSQLAQLVACGFASFKYPANLLALASEAHLDLSHLRYLRTPSNETGVVACSIVKRLPYSIELDRLDKNDILCSIP